MHSKYLQSFCQFIIIFSFVSIFSAENAFGQKSFPITFNSVKTFFGEDNKSVHSTRPRIYKEKEIPTENSVKKAVTNFSFERRAFEEINQQRAAKGLTLLVWNDEAAKIARIHSENMANFKFFSHEGLDGLMVNERADQVGASKWRAIGENIAYNRGYANPIEFAVERWMNSTGHRENILNERWKESGIGIAITQDGTYYFTQVFIQK